MAKAHTVVDNFNDNTINTTLWTVSPSASPTITEANGRVEIRPTNNATGTYVYYTTATYDVTESSFRAEVVRAAGWR
jgi:hypothetical protein